MYENDFLKTFFIFKTLFCFHSDMSSRKKWNETTIGSSKHYWKRFGNHCAVLSPTMFYIGCHENNFKRLDDLVDTVVDITIWGKDDGPPPIIEHLGSFSFLSTAEMEYKYIGWDTIRDIGVKRVMLTTRATDQMFDRMEKIISML